MELKGLALDLIEVDPDIIEFNEIDEEAIRNFLNIKSQMTPIKGIIIIFGTGGETKKNYGFTK